MPFNFQNGLLVFDFRANSLKEFEFELFLLKNKEFENWSLSDNKLFFAFKNEDIQVGMITTLNLKIDSAIHRFRGLMRLSLTHFDLEAFIVDPWESAFGLEQFSVLEAGLRLGVTFEPAFAFGLSGRGKLVDTELAFIVAFNPASVKENVFSA